MFGHFIFLIRQLVLLTVNILPCFPYGDRTEILKNNYYCLKKLKLYFQYCKTHLRSLGEKMVLLQELHTNIDFKQQARDGKGLRRDLVTSLSWLKVFNG